MDHSLFHAQKSSPTRVLPPSDLNTARRSLDAGYSIEPRSWPEVQPKALRQFLPSRLPTAGQEQRPRTSFMDTGAGREENSTSRFRRSLHFNGSPFELFSDTAVMEEKEPRRNGLRGLIRRASVSLKSKTRPRRNTLTLGSAMEDVHENRPSTASATWHKLRQAASFHKPKPRFCESPFDCVDSCDDLMVPIPGSGLAPPVIPRGSGGAAARATAALQNQYLDRTRQFHYLDELASDGDDESGIGIAVVDSVLSELQNVSLTTPSVNAVGVDFIKQLPIELSIQILSHLDHHGLLQTSLVSRAWLELSNNRHVWREAFYREKSKTYAMGRPLSPGSGLGLPVVQPNKPWKDVYKIRQQLQSNWKYGKAKPVYLSGHLDSIYCVQFDEKKIITGSRDKTVRIWNMHTHRCELIIGPPDVVAARKLIFSSDNKFVHNTIQPDGTTTLGYRPRTVSYPIHHNASILCLQYDDRILVTGSSDGSCIVYDIKDEYKPIFQLRHHSAAVLDLAFDEKYIVTCSKDFTICVWDRITGTLVKQLQGHSGPVNAVQMRGNTIVSCSGDFKVKLWNIDSGRIIREFIGHTKGLACSQFSEDSRYIASAGNDRIIRIWDANTGECLQAINAHENLVRSLHIDSASGLLVSGSYDQDIKVFDMASGTLLLDFPKWHSSWVLGAKSDYRRIVSTGQDPKILIMDFGINIDGIELLES